MSTSLSSCRDISPLIQISLFCNIFLYLGSVTNKFVSVPEILRSPENSTLVIPLLMI